MAPDHTPRRSLANGVKASTKRSAFLVGCLLVSLSSTAQVSFGCEFPNGMIRSTASSDGRSQEFRVTLGPPDYRDDTATKQHLIFATVLARLVTAEVESRSRERCSIVASTSLFPDLRIVPTNTEKLCADAIRVDFKPREELVSKITSSIASARSVSPAGYMTEADNILREALRHVYAKGTPMAALVSVEPSDFESMSVPSFLRWFEAERANQRAALTPIAYCESSEDKPNARPSNGGMPYSNISQSQVLSVAIPRGRLLKSDGLSYAVLGNSHHSDQPQPKDTAIAKMRFQSVR